MRALSLVASLACARALDFFVSPSGSDATGSGSAASPWATPLPALPAIAAAKVGGLLPTDVTVHLASGVYFLPAPLNFTAASGGDGTHTVTFCGPADPAAAPAVLSAGVPVAGPWAAVAGAAGVFSAPFPHWAPLFGGKMVRQAWDAATGARLPLARSPIGYAKAAGDWGAALPAGTLTPEGAPGLIAQAELVLYHNWVSSQNRIASVNISNSSVFVAGVAGDPFFGAGGTLRFALQNVPDAAALAPGSFFVDRIGRTLTLRPAGGAAPAPGAVIIEAMNEPVLLSGAPGAPVVGVSLVNLTVAHAAAELEASCLGDGCGQQSASDLGTAAVHARFATDCHLRGVEVVGAGAYGVWFDDGSVNCSITESWLHDLGAGGVRVGTGDNSGSTATAPAMNVTVSDNEVADGGHIVPAGTGIFTQEAYATAVVHNHVHHFFYTGVATGWTWGYAQDSDAAQLVGWNHIHDIFQNELSDGGCVYNLGRSPGTQIRNNLCHDVSSYGYGGWGLYLDEGSSNVTMRDNIVYATKDAGFHQHYGTDNVITNNIFAFPSTLPCDAAAAGGQCDEAAIRSSQHMDCWSPKPPTTPDYGCNSSFAFRGNIILLGAEDVGGGVVNKTTTLHKTFVAYDRPSLDGLTNMTYGANVYWSNALADPSTQLIFGNNYEPLNFSSWQERHPTDATSVIADPRFADAAGRNFTLLPGSPALALGFQPIDMSNVGPRAPFRRAPAASV